MAASAYQDIKKSLRQLYLEDNRPWPVGFSGGKDSTMLASLVLDVAFSLPPAERTKPISVVCTDTRAEIPAIVEMVEGTLRQMQRCSQQNGLKDLNQVRKLEKEIARDKRINADTFHRMLAKVEEYSENDREHEKQRDDQKCLRFAEIH
jgi:3'-phosphoadenosine 5'-phosphosulfate sulfotransferase (PAPS reductase)/FAD synthetase